MSTWHVLDFLVIDTGDRYDHSRIEDGPSVSMAIR